MTAFPCTICGGTYEADTQPVADAKNWTADDFGKLMEAQGEHTASHPDSLKTQGGPDQRPKRDWVGCRCRGTCRCSTRRRARR